MQSDKGRTGLLVILLFVSLIPWSVAILAALVSGRFAGIYADLLSPDAQLPFLTRFALAAAPWSWLIPLALCALPVFLHARKMLTNTAAVMVAISMLAVAAGLFLLMFVGLMQPLLSIISDLSG